MFKFLNSLIAHTHCYCDKKMDWVTSDGKHRIIIMACNKCGKEEMHKYEV